MDALIEMVKNPSVLLAGLCIRMTVEALIRLFRRGGEVNEVRVNALVILASAGYARLWNINLLKAFEVTSGIPLVDFVGNAVLLGYMVMIGHDALDKLAGK